MSTLSSANVTDVNLVLKERTHMHLCINMLIFSHNLGNWPIISLKLAIAKSFRRVNYTQHEWMRPYPLAEHMQLALKSRQHLCGISEILLCLQMSWFTYLIYSLTVSQ